MSDLLVTAIVADSSSDGLVVSYSADAANWCVTDIPQSSKASPALAVLKGDLWAAFRGNNETTIYTTGLSDWQANKSIGQDSELAPALASLGGKLWVAYVAQSSGRIELVSSNDGIHWSITTDTGHSSEASPALAVLNGNLWVAFRGNDDTIYVASSSNWGDKKSTGKSSRLAPALAVFNDGNLWIAYIGKATGHVELISSTGGANWSLQSSDTGQSSKIAPSLVVFDNKLWAAYIGEATGRVELISSKDGSQWSAKSDIGQASQFAPALAVIAAAAPPKGMGGFNQYVFSSPVPSSQPYVALLDLAVEIKITEALTVSPTSGFRGGTTTVPIAQPITTAQPIGFQIDGFSQSPDATISWQQYGITMSPDSNQLLSFAENWPLNRNLPNVFNLRSTPNFVPLPNDLTIPAGWTIRIAFQQQSDGTISGFKCSVTDRAGAKVGDNLDIALLGKKLARGGPIIQKDLAKMVAFQVVLVGWANDAGSTLLSGAGTITCTSKTPLKPSVQWPGESDDAFGTGEEANSTYGLVPAQLSTSIAQSFGVRVVAGNWSKQVELTDQATSAGPALALNGVFCMAWKGVGQSNIFVSVSRDNGTSWGQQVQLTDRATQNAPALAVVGGKFVMAWQGLGQNNIWVSTSIDGLSWFPPPPTELGDQSTSAGPALACAGGPAVMAWQGLGQNNIWVSTSTDGLHWSQQVELNDRATQFGPSVAASPRKFVMAWCGLNENNIWVSTSKDGVKWTVPYKPFELSDRATNGTPAITYFAGLEVFYMAWRGLNQNNIWVAWSTDGESWTPEYELDDRSTNSGPALSPVAHTLYMAWQGSDDNNIWTSRFERART